MDALAKLISALASLAWPLVLAALLYKLYGPIRTLVESAHGRKFTIKVAGNELTMEEASEQQRVIVNDLQSKLAELEKRLNASPTAQQLPVTVPSASGKRILWVDDNPKNNSFLVESLEERGARVDIALSTDEALTKSKKLSYDIILSDMGRPEGDKAGIDLIQKIKSISPKTPVYIFCGSWAAHNLRNEALSAGAADITSSGTTLLSALPLWTES
ncbi:MAG: response regulator [Phycisphaerae bacterium]|nr:response regulator [Phycisphaerae bacterium]